MTAMSPMSAPISGPADADATITETPFGRTPVPDDDGGSVPPSSGGGGTPPPFRSGPSGPSGPPPAPVRRLRRSKQDRVAAGLCGGLGRYFGVDPVIFRVLLAVLVLFGGSGIVLYLLGWLAVPDEDAANAPIDKVVDRMRRRSLPFVLVVAGGLFVLWCAIFSWWAPFSLFPAALVVIALMVLLSRRDRATVDATSYPRSGPGSTDEPLDPAGVQLRSWYDETKARSRERRARSRPVRRVTLALLIASVAGLAVADAVHGIPVGTYFWVIGGIALAGLLVGLVTRRTPWLVVLFLLPAAVGIVSFGTSGASVHDGSGDRSWTPASAADVRDQYRLAFGRTTLDLSQVTAGQVTSIRAGSPTKVVQGAGQVRLLIPRTLPVRVEAHIHQGVVTIGGQHRDDGWDVEATYLSPGAAGATSVLTIDVHLTAGQLSISYLD